MAVTYPNQIAPAKEKIEAMVQDSSPGGETPTRAEYNEALELFQDLQEGGMVENFMANFVPDVLHSQNKVGRNRALKNAFPADTWRDFIAENVAANVPYDTFIAKFNQFIAE